MFAIRSSYTDEFLSSSGIVGSPPGVPFLTKMSIFLADCRLSQRRTMLSYLGCAVPASKIKVRRLSSIPQEPFIQQIPLFTAISIPCTASTTNPTSDAILLVLVDAIPLDSKEENVALSCAALLGLSYTGVPNSSYVT